MTTEGATPRNNNRTVWIVVGAIVVIALLVFVVLAMNGNRDIDEPADVPAAASQGASNVGDAASNATAGVRDAGSDAADEAAAAARSAADNANQAAREAADATARAADTTGDRVSATIPAGDATINVQAPAR
jgi:hypothetical protein